MAEEEQVAQSVKELLKLLAVKRGECEETAGEERASGESTGCSTIWDGIMCWPGTNPREMLSQQCPHYFPGLDRQGNATKECTENGTWFVSTETHQEWTNYSQCYAGRETVIMVPVQPVAPVNESVFKEYIPILKKISHFGYGVSLTTLVIAFFILITLKKLHCSRNMLHLHLFMSFIMKSVLTFAKESLFEQGIGLSSDFVLHNGTSYFIEKTNRNWECKAVITIWQYFIMANYSWVLMEGLYIHNLIIFALFSDSNSIILYVILGWGLPMIFVAFWVFAKIKLENELCWTTGTDSKNFLIIRIPIIVSILLSFILFVNIVRLLLVKLRSTVQEETQRYWKWAKSTLILIPLFGVHYAVFHGMSYSRGVDENLELVWLFCDQFFASFQGFFVAVLFCFLNTEIQTEMKRKLRRFRCSEAPPVGWQPNVLHNLPTEPTAYTDGGYAPCIDSRGVNLPASPCKEKNEEGSSSILFGIFRLCRVPRSRSEGKASKRTETTEFMTNDSFILMVHMEKEKWGINSCNSEELKIADENSPETE